MRYGIIPRTLRERVALRFGKVPVPLVDCLGPLMQTRALMAAVRLGVFEAMRDGSFTAAEIARSCHLDADALDMTLRLLVSMGYVERDSAGNYRLSAVARRTLVAGAPMELRSYIDVNYVQWKLIENLESLLQTGKGIDLHAGIHDAGDWDAYQRAMLDVARLAAPVVARLTPVPSGARRMLDLGGSHGLLGAAICRRHPPMRSTVIDLAPALVAARPLAAAAGIADIVEHREGNLLTDDFGSGVDVVLLANIVHHFTPEETSDVLRRAHAAMNDGGTVVIWDFERPAGGASTDCVGDGAALFFRLTSTSQVVTSREYEAWLREAGFRDVRSRRSIRAPMNVLTLGVR